MSERAPQTQRERDRGNSIDFADLRSEVKTQLRLELRRVAGSLSLSSLIISIAMWSAVQGARSVGGMSSVTWILVHESVLKS